MNMFMPGGGAIDLDKGTIGFFGDGNPPIEVTSVEDTARMVARVALDSNVQPGKFAFSGDRVSFREAGEIIAARTGRPIKPISVGSEADLRTATREDAIGGSLNARPHRLYCGDRFVTTAGPASHIAERPTVRLDAQRIADDVGD